MYAPSRQGYATRHCATFFSPMLALQAKVSGCPSDVVLWDRILMSCAPRSGPLASTAVERGPATAVPSAEKILACNGKSPSVPFRFHGLGGNHVPEQTTRAQLGGLLQNSFGPGNDK